MYYYRKKSKKIWIITILIIIIGIIAIYWFVKSFPKKLELEPVPADETVVQVAPARLYQIDNDVQIDPDNSGWSDAKVNLKLNTGDLIRTGENSKAVLVLNQTVVRLDENSQVKLALFSKDKIILEQLSGQVYHKVGQLDNYLVKALNTVVTPSGTKFNLKVNDENEQVDLLVVEEKVNLEILQDSQVVLSGLVKEGESLSVDLTADKNGLFAFSSYDEEELESDWYLYNLEEDKKVIELSPDSLVESDEEAEVLKLKVEAEEEGNKLTWVPYDKDDFQSYKIVRSETNDNLTYPDDGYIKGSPDISLDFYLDEDIESEKFYYYKVCILDNLNQAICGNVATVQSSENDEEKDLLQLSGEVVDNIITLNWSAPKDDDFMFVKLVRSENNNDLRYPADGYIKTFYTSDEAEFEDESARLGISYYYRLCMKKKSDGKVLCGNVIKMELDEEQADDINLAASAKDEGVYLSWNRINNEEFDGYDVLRSGSGGVSYTTGTKIKAINLSSVTTYTDTTAEAGNTYYYKVCYNLDNESVCSGEQMVQIASEEEPVEEEKEPVAESDTVPPRAPRAGGSISETGFSLSWGANTEDDFKEYRVVKSTSNASPTYPGAGSLGAKLKGNESLFDSAVNSSSSGTTYYRVCAVDTSDNVNCGNVVTVVDGVVQ